MRNRLALPSACTSRGRNRPAHRKWHATASSQPCGVRLESARVSRQSLAACDRVQAGMTSRYHDRQNSVKPCRRCVSAPEKVSTFARTGATGAQSLTCAGCERQGLAQSGMSPSRKAHRHSFAEVEAVAVLQPRQRSVYVGRRVADLPHALRGGTDN